MSKKAKKLLYIAYGSNINLQQMRSRCPTAKRIGTAMLSGYELTFCGVATIAPKKGAAVPVLAWELQLQDEKNLDRYEGYPNLYHKKIFEIEVDGEPYKAMAYVMSSREIAPPPRSYFLGIYKGYLANGMDTTYLTDALIRAFQHEPVAENLLPDEEPDDDLLEDEEDFGLAQEST